MGCLLFPMHRGSYVVFYAQIYENGGFVYHNAASSAY